jgi:hypothetical protein
MDGSLLLVDSSVHNVKVDREKVTRIFIYRFRNVIFIRRYVLQTGLKIFQMPLS